MTIRYANAAGSNTAPYDTVAKGATNPQTIMDLATAGDENRYYGTFTLTVSLDIDTYQGDITNGFIKHVGCNASGENDGSRSVFDGDSAATNCVLVAANMDYHWWENLDFTGAIEIGFNNSQAGSTHYAFIQCRAFTNGTYGFGNGVGLSHSIFIQCAAYGNADGYDVGNYQKYLFCSARDNSDSGFRCNNSSATTFINCISFDNTTDGWENLRNGNLLYNCVSDSNMNDGVLCVAGTNYLTVIASRITNHDGAGDIGINASGEILIHGWNYYENNDGNNIQNAELAIEILNAGGGTDQEDQSNTLQGYTSLTEGAEDYRLASTATGYSQEVQIPMGQ